ncbi:hypothetical protein DFP72DRAFT_1059613 [Ephemerocybe angulata]|uniref:Uncharacterized protein n=1 Tax=Ephemerocybe angulata TaxID=980116 RepID=A0A8H6IFQ8_9AGAR|nr:hypothetical protein DFP72DRAFT_1059613 [Tulosesus angulatus]
MTSLNTPVTLTLGQLVSLLKALNVNVDETGSGAGTVDAVAATLSSLDIKPSVDAKPKLPKSTDPRVNNQYPENPTTTKKVVVEKELKIEKAAVPATPSDGDTFACGVCGANNRLATPATAWYCVTSGLRAGVVCGWYAAAPLVQGVSKAVYFKCVSFEEAVRSFDRAWDGGDVIARNGFIGVNPMD